MRTVKGGSFEVWALRLGQLVGSAPSPRPFFTVGRDGGLCWLPVHWQVGPGWGSAGGTASEKAGPGAARPTVWGQPDRERFLPVSLGTLGQGWERSWAGPAPWSLPSESGWVGVAARIPGWEPRGVFCNHNMISCAEQ